MNGKTWIGIGAVCAALSVMCGAFAAHALPNYLAMRETDPDFAERRIENLDVGARYQMYHALAFVAIGVMQIASGDRRGQTAAWWILLGTVLFSGSLYAYSFTGMPKFGMITPLGGISLIVGWFSLAISVSRRTRDPKAAPLSAPLKS